MCSNLKTVRFYDPSNPNATMEIECGTCEECKYELGSQEQDLEAEKLAYDSEIVNLRHASRNER